MPAEHSRRSERLETHNVSIDEQAARSDLCGQVHLQTGRTCTLPAGHPGSYSFKPAEQAHQQTHHHR